MNIKKQSKNNLTMKKIIFRNLTNVKFQQLKNAISKWFSNGGEALDIRKITEIRESPFNATGVPKKEVISGGGIASGRTKYHEKFNPKKNKK